jgi:hypothetical protein
MFSPFWIAATATFRFGPSSDSNYRVYLVFRFGLPANHGLTVTSVNSKPKTGGWPNTHHSQPRRSQWCSLDKGGQTLLVFAIRRPRFLGLINRSINRLFNRTRTGDWALKKVGTEGSPSNAPLGAPTLLGHISRLNMESWMPRPRQRVCLQDGLKLDLNRLARKGFIRFGRNIGVRGITWTHSYCGEVASGTICADMSGPHEGWFSIQLGSLDQRIILVPRAPTFRRSAMVLHVPSQNRPVSVLGSQTARCDFAADRPGAGKSLTIPIQWCYRPRARRRLRIPGIAARDSD